MSEWLDIQNWIAVLTPERVAAGTRALVILLVGLVLMRLISRVADRWAQAKLDRHQHLLVHRLVRGLVLGLVLMTALDQVGVELGVVLGAAGVLSVALGFASQTAASNLISGLFLMIEHPFVVGDVLRLGNDLTGEVLAIDALSVKLRTFDNLYVRVPNEDLIRSRFTNLSHFPIRRADLMIGVAYKEDLEKVRAVLAKVADENPLCMAEPEPLFLFQGYGDSALQFQFSVWGDRTKFVALRNSMYQDIKRAFDAEGIEIPFPHRSIYTGSVTEPFPIRIFGNEDPR